MKRTVWIVEMLNERGQKPRWEPTVTASFTREECLAERRDWKVKCPHDHFRVAHYVAKETPR